MKKVIIAMFALVVIIGFVACGSTEDKAAKEGAAVLNAYIEGSKAIVEQYKAAKTAEDLKAADEAAEKLDAEMKAKGNEVQMKYEKVDKKKLEAISSYSNAFVEFTKAYTAVMTAKQEAAATVASMAEEKKEDKQ